LIHFCGRSIGLQKSVDSHLKVIYEVSFFVWIWLLQILSKPIDSKLHKCESQKVEGSFVYFKTYVGSIGKADGYKQFARCWFSSKVNVFSVVKPCSVAVGYQDFGVPCCLHLHGEGSMVLRNFSMLPQHYTVSHVPRLKSSLCKKKKKETLISHLVFVSFQSRPTAIRLTWLFCR